MTRLISCAVIVVLTCGAGVADLWVPMDGRTLRAGLSQQAAEPVPVSALRASIPFAGETA